MSVHFTQFIEIPDIIVSRIPVVVIQINLSMDAIELITESFGTCFHSKSEIIVSEIEEYCEIYWQSNPLGLPS